MDSNKFSEIHAYIYSHKKRYDIVHDEFDSNQIIHLIKQKLCYIEVGVI